MRRLCPHENCVGQHLMRFQNKQLRLCRAFNQDHRLSELILLIEYFASFVIKQLIDTVRTVFVLEMTKLYILSVGLYFIVNSYCLSILFSVDASSLLQVYARSSQLCVGLVRYSLILYSVLYLVGRLHMGLVALCMETVAAGVRYTGLINSLC